MRASVKASKSRGSMRRGRAHGLGGSIPLAAEPRAPFKPARKSGVTYSQAVREAMELAPLPRRGGSKPISPNGEAMAARKIRMTDSDWEDAKLIGMETIRAWIRKAAAKQRSK